MIYTPFGPVPEVVADPGRLTEDIARLLAELVALTGLGLVAAANCSLGARLSLPADVVFDRLRGLSYTAGAPELPCCEGDDDAAVQAWADAVRAVAGTWPLAAAA